MLMAATLKQHLMILLLLRVLQSTSVLLTGEFCFPVIAVTFSAAIHLENVEKLEFEGDHCLAKVGEDGKIGKVGGKCVTYNDSV